MTNTLYEMDNQLRAIDELLAINEDPETQEILEGAKAQLNQDIENKMDSILQYMADCDGKIAQYKEEVARLQKKIKSFSNKKDFLKNLCYNHLVEKGVQKADYGTYTLSIVKNPAKVVLTDDADVLLPDQFCTITRSPNKTAIKEAMTDGELFVQVGDKKVVLARLDDTATSLRVK